MCPAPERSSSNARRRGRRRSGKPPPQDVRGNPREDHAHVEPEQERLGDEIIPEQEQRAQEKERRHDRITPPAIASLEIGAAAPQHEYRRAGEPAPSPAPPNSVRATSAATSSAPFTCWIGMRCRYTRFAARYNAPTEPVPMNIARGRLRCGSFTSPPTNARSPQPSYAHRIATIESRNGDSPTAARWASIGPTPSPCPPPSAKPSTTSRARAPTFNAVLTFCTIAAR